MKLTTLIPSNTFINRYLDYVLKNNSKMVYNYYFNNILVDNKFIENQENKEKFKYNLIEIKEIVNGTNSYSSENILDIDMKIKIPEMSHDNIVQEKILVSQSMYLYKISYKLILNNKQINNINIIKDDYNSKNFNGNFKYFMHKHNYLNGIEYRM